MAIVTPAAITVTTTAASVISSTNGSNGGPQSLVLYAPAGNTNPVLVGGTAALVAFPIIAGASLSIDLFAGDDIWTKVAAGTETLNVIYNRV